MEGSFSERYTSNLAQFNKELDEFAKCIPTKVSIIQKKLVLEALRRLILRTPVDTGRARGNWQVTIANPAEGQVEGDWPKSSGKGKKENPGIRPDDGRTITKGMAVLTGLPDYQVVWISNNVDYIEFLEHGSSTQAPEGMLAITIEELRNMFKAVQ